MSPVILPPKHRKRQPRVLELTVNVSAVLPGEIPDWPNHVQDAIYEALERKAKQLGGNFTIVSSRSDTDVDAGPYVNVYAIESFALMAATETRQ